MEFRKYGYTVFAMSLLLSTVGLIFIYTASYFYCQKSGMKPYFFVMKQAFALAIGIATSILIYKFFDYRKLSNERFTWAFYWISVAILVFVIIFGKEVHGSKNWLFIGGVSIQPSEFAKVFVIIFVSSYLKRKWYQVQNIPRVYASFILLTFVPIGLILLERDLGSAAILSIVVFAILFVTEIKIKYILYPIAAGFSVFSIAIAMAPYRIARIKILLSPFSYYHTHGKYSSYQLVQAIVSFAKGGITGVGIGQGEQKLFFLPYPFSDFIYAHIGEEAGLLGTFLILIAYAIIVYCGLAIADATDEKLGKYLSLGLTLYIFLQAIIHVGVNIGILPTTGITLPFVSLGGSSLTSSFIAIGLIMNVARLTPKETKINFQKV